MMKMFARTPLSFGFLFLTIACSTGDGESPDLVDANQAGTSSGGLQGMNPNDPSGGTANVSSGGAAAGNGGSAVGSGASNTGGSDANTGGSGGNTEVGSGGSASTNSGGSSSDGSGTGGASSGGKIFSECRFHFGAVREFALNHADIRKEIDYFTPGWMGLSNTFDQSYVCDDVKGTLQGKVPVVVAYVSAFYAKREQSLHDCNVGQPDLCTYGSKIIKENQTAIINIYRSYAQGYANCLGTNTPIIFEMEPDWFQYTLSNQTDPMTAQQSGQIMKAYVSAMKEFLPNAHFSMDISPWVPPNNGSDHGADWYSHFDMSQFTFINTSGGGTDAATAKIRASNNMTWAGVSAVTGKPVLADTGYGVNGQSAGHDSAWDNVSHINARINDGVIGISQYNPNSNWGSTIAAMRGQLGTPKFCP